MLVDPGVLSEIYGEKKKTFEDLLFLFSLPAGGNIVYAALPVLQSKKRVHWNQQFILYLTAPLLVLFF